MRTWQAGRLGHALLLCAPVGTGLHHLSALLVAYLLEIETPGNPLEIISRAHPDLLWLRRESMDEDSKSRRSRSWILVHQIRTLREYLAQKPVGKCKIAVIDLAEDLNQSAANALLKVLEEPVSDSYMFLLSHSPSRLLPTIRSRCTQIFLPTPTPEETRLWLQHHGKDSRNMAPALWLTDKTPFTTLELLASDDFVKLLELIPEVTLILMQKRNNPAIVERLGALDGMLVNHFLIRWLKCALEESENQSTAMVHGEKNDVRESLPDYQRPAQPLSLLSGAQLIELYDHCQRHLRILASMVNVNQTLLVANFLDTCVQMLREDSAIAKSP